MQYVLAVDTCGGRCRPALPRGRAPGECSVGAATRTTLCCELWGRVDVMRRKRASAQTQAVGGAPLGGGAGGPRERGVSEARKPSATGLCGWLRGSGN